MTKRQKQANLIAMLIGLTATAAVVIAYVRGGLDRLELITIDQRFRYTNSIREFPDPNDPAIVCIDIDDTSLGVVGRWPWPREKQAALVAIPAEMGARAILVDLTWNEPQPLRSETPKDADITADPLELGGESVELLYPDYELRAALEEAGNAYLAYDYRTDDIESSDAFNAIVDDKLADMAGRTETQPSAGVSRPRVVEDPVQARAALVAALEIDPTLNAGRVGEVLDLPDNARIGDWIDGCRIAALRRRLRRWLDAAPDRERKPPQETFSSFYAEITGHAPSGDSPLKAALVVAFRDVLGYRATTASTPFELASVAPIAERVDGITPVYFLHAQAARRCGFVVFAPDRDGVVRRMPLVRQHGGVALVQLAFTLACDQLGVTRGGITAAPGYLTLRTPKGPREDLDIQLDDRGRTMVPWVRGRDWTKVFKHMPADALWALHSHRQNLAHNRELVLEALWRILSIEPFAALAEHRKTIEGVFDLDRQIRRSRYRGELGDARELSHIRDALVAETAGIERLVRQRADAARKELLESNAPPDDPGRRALESAAALIDMIDRCHRVEPELRKTVDDLAARIRGIVAGKICLIGYTATSLADMKPTPTSPSSAGVMAHANMLNGLLSERMVRWTDVPANAAIAAALGVLTALIATFMRARLALLLTVFLAASYVAIAGALAFYQWTYLVALAPAVSAILIVYVCISAYRYVFIEGERRQLATALGQYTSKEMARQMAENPELCKRAEMREVTTVFTDLKGFTTISERIGAQRTQKVLNICLGRFTEIMLHHEGMVNKFIGDGIFAFWNPVIYPQSDHARRACETAIDLLSGLTRLKREQRECGGDAAFDEIVLRVGIATGKAIVGPCGSEQKYDYTCIGDSVNVAARLESANKFYGTRVLVSAATRDDAGDGFEWRALGGVRVKGKRQAVPVYELLGRVGGVSADALAYAAEFGQAVALFQRRDWRAALDAFEACHKQHPDDLAATDYIEATQELLDHPPGEAWLGAIELKEK